MLTVECLARITGPKEKPWLDQALAALNEVPGVRLLMLYRDYQAFLLESPCDIERAMVSFEVDNGQLKPGRMEDLVAKMAAAIAPLGCRITVWTASWLGREICPGGR